MKTKGKNIATVCLIVIIVAFFAVSHFMQKVKLYDDEATTGNTSGNLLNGGLFCEHGDTIYFANPYDHNMLYSMDTSLGNVKQISKDAASYLNIAGKYMFYTKRNDKKKIDTDSFLALSNTGLYRANLKGTGIAQLYDDPTQVATLYGNYIYYQHYDQQDGLMLYVSKIDGSSDTMLLNDACAPYAIQDNTIYYTGYRTDHAIHSIGINGGSSNTLLDGNYTALTLQNGYLYFLDMDDGYSLKRMHLDGSNVETLVSEQLATYNVSQDGNTVYCQIDNGSDNGLYELDAASKSLNLLASGDFNYLHLTTDYLFYESFDQGSVYVLDLATNQSTEWKWEHEDDK